jgi:heat-inducible transcriptional repressor
MNERQQNLLAEVIRSYVREAEPVGSKALEGSSGFSSATIRNEMADLENQGYLWQPHTSAGRVPTAKAWQYYVDHLVSAKEPKALEQRTMDNLWRQLQNDQTNLLKSLAKTMAQYAGEAVVVGFGPYEVYYTGFSNLFQQPEFSTVDMVQAIGRAVDHLDESMVKLYEQTPSDRVEVMLGETNPFGEDCAVVYTRCSSGKNSSLMGFLGPLRMDYDANIGRLNYVRSLFQS